MTHQPSPTHDPAIADSMSALRDTLAHSVREVDAALADLAAGRRGAAVGGLLAVEPLLDRAGRLHGAVLELHRLAAEGGA